MAGDWTIIGHYCFAQDEGHEMKNAKMFIGGVEVPVESVSFKPTSELVSELPIGEPFTCEMSFMVDGADNAWGRLLELVCGVYSTNDWRWPQLELQSEAMAWWFAIARSRTVREGELN